jgi:hypothetical protein
MKWLIIDKNIIKHDDIKFNYINKTLKYKMYKILNL